MKYVYFFLILLCLQANGQRKYLSLAGNWSFKIDSLNEGENDKWYAKPNSFFKQQILLPGTMDDAGYGNPVNVAPVLKREVLLHLWRKVTYTGAAWYTKEVFIPAEWANKAIEFSCERVIWDTKVWVDGKPLVGEGESLVTPHTFNGSILLSPGKHTIVLRIDNRRKYDISLGDYNFAQAYTDDSQIIWNGVIGKIGVTAKEKVYSDNVQVFADIDKKTVKVVSIIYNELSEKSKTHLHYSIRHNNIIKSSLDTNVVLETGKNEIVTSLKMNGNINLWDEFNPTLYTIIQTIQSNKATDTYSTTFGFREISTKGVQLFVNKRRLFLRGTLECSIFPKEGHTPTDKLAWKRVFGIAKSYGLNHLRFHSWCPPEAAFAVADELGFYLQIELPVWSLKIGKDAAADSFLKAEAERMIKYYGNHPSFCFWSMGNEMQGNMQWLSDEVNYLKAKDKRRLYTTTTFTFEEGFGKMPVAADDYFVTQYTQKGWVRGQGVFDAEVPTFNKDYTASTDGLKVPLITHEIGQYAVYPNIDEINQYTGVLQPLNFIAVKNDLQHKKLLPLASAYTQSSGKLAALLYKEEIERALKTSSFSGFQLLDLHDFPGQGTALVGILDAFWNSKGLISASDFRKFCSPVVPLIRYSKATYTNIETFKATVEIANFSNSDLKNAKLKWAITTDKNVEVASGKFSVSSIAVGNGINIGSIEASLSKITIAQKLKVSVSIVNTNYTNDWNIWVYPVNKVTPKNEVVFTTDVDSALLALKAGKKVLLNPAKEKINGLEGKFVPVFWSPVHFPNQPGTMGLLINPLHPVFKNFPTDSFSNWQWWDLCKNSTTLVLDSTTIDTSAIVLRNIDNFFKNRNLASIIEAKVGDGKLLFCTMDIHSNLSQRPVANQLKNSFLHYMESNSFNPKTIIDKQNLKQIIKQ